MIERGLGNLSSFPGLYLYLSVVEVSSIRVCTHLYSLKSLLVSSLLVSSYYMVFNYN